MLHVDSRLAWLRWYSLWRMKLCTCSSSSSPMRVRPYRYVHSAVRCYCTLFYFHPRYIHSFLKLIELLILILLLITVVFVKYKIISYFDLILPMKVQADVVINTTVIDVHACCWSPCHIEIVPRTYY